jgi:hypothetical protein
MSSNRIEWTGLDELYAALRQLPAHLAAEAVDLVDNTVEVTAASLIQSYPPLGPAQPATPGQAAHVPGALRRGVKWSTTPSQFGVSGEVKSTAPHAHLWEFGTQNRTTSKGWNRGHLKDQYNRGLVGIAIRERAKLNKKLVELVRKAGFEVTGSV